MAEWLIKRSFGKGVSGGAIWHCVIAKTLCAVALFKELDDESGFAAVIGYAM